MGCNCGGGINRTLPKGIIKNSPGVFKSRPVVNQILTPKTNPKYESVFTNITDSINILTYQNSGVYFIGKEGSAECNYLRNLLPKIIVATTDYQKTSYFSIDYTKTNGIKDLQPSTTLFILKNTIYKSYRGIFDFKTALIDFLSQL